MTKEEKAIQAVQAKRFTWGTEDGDVTEENEDKVDNNWRYGKPITSGKRDDK